jgi:uncharacterized membrane protein
MASPADSRLEQLLARVLWTGVLASSVFLVLGLLLSMGNPSVGVPWLGLGLIVLLATPVARVAASAVSYVIQRDWLFAVLTMIVLLELGASVVAGLVFHRRL